MTDEEKVKQDLNVLFGRVRNVERSFSLPAILKFVVLAGAAVAVIVAAAKTVTQVATTPYQLTALWHADTALREAQAQRDLHQDMRLDSVLEEIGALQLQMRTATAILCVKATATERRLARVRCTAADWDNP